MVYYYTSKNVKIIQTLMQDFRALTDITAYEYICVYFKSHFQDIEEQKRKQFINVFLGINKHGFFLKNIVREAGRLSDIEKDYFIIITYGILFQVSSNNALDILKCMFNLSKRLLNAFVAFFSNKDNVGNISQIALKVYDNCFVNENIASSILSWQPILFELTKTYFKKYLYIIQTYDEKRSSSLNNITKIRKNQDTKKFAPNFKPQVKFKVYSNSKIRRRMYKRNANLININNYTKTKTAYYNYDKQISVKKESFEDVCTKPVYRNMNASTTLKKASTLKKNTTISVINKINNTKQQCEQNELKWLHDIIHKSENTLMVDKLLKYNQQEKEKEMLLNMRKCRLRAQISHEDAIIAKTNVQNEKKRKHNEFIKEKELWEKEIEAWKLKQFEYNRKQVEKMSLHELKLQNSKMSMIEKRKEMAETVRYNTKVLRELVFQNKAADLERRINIIKEIKTLSMFAKSGRLQKARNLNETAGFGFLCEMSFAELQKRLTALKISLDEELEEKKNKIITLNFQKKQELEKIKKSNNVFMDERKRMRHLKISKMNINISSTDEISKLEELLRKKRSQRILLTKENS